MFLIRECTKAKQQAENKKFQESSKFAVKSTYFKLYICISELPYDDNGKNKNNKKGAYHLHFGCKTGNRYKSWAPNYCCITCVTDLLHWLNEKKKSPPVSVVQKEPTNGCSDCHYYMVLPIKALI